MVVFLQQVTAPLIVGAIEKDELDFIMRGKEFQVFKVILFFLTASGTFYIENFYNFFRNLVNRQGPTGLQHDPVTLFQECFHKRINILLQ